MGLWLVLVTQAVSSACRLSHPVCLLPRLPTVLVLDSYASVSPNQLFLLEVTLVLMFCHSSKTETNTPREATTCKLSAIEEEPHMPRLYDQQFNI
ncbi:hypothetical protein LEMLEM_LOCUS7883 [Lemmus lemmus]